MKDVLAKEFSDIVLKSHGKATIAYEFFNEATDFKTHISVLYTIKATI